MHLEVNSEERELFLLDSGRVSNVLEPRVGIWGRREGVL